MYLSIDKTLRHPIKDQRVEKYLLRQAFNDENIIPHEVLWRQKEAFSDGCSNIQKSWFEHIQDYVEPQVSNSDFNDNFKTKEAYWYYKTFKEFYPNSALKVNNWLPKWSNTKDPSARTLNIYV